MLTVVDLNRAEELSSSDMAKVAGGLNCGQQGTMMAFYFDLVKTFDNIGAYGAARAMEDKGLEVSHKGCA